MCKAHKKLPFYVEIVKFGLILTQFELFWRGKNIGRGMPPWCHHWMSFLCNLPTGFVFSQFNNCGTKFNETYIVVQHIERRYFAGKVNFDFFIWCIKRAFSQLKKNWKLLLFSVSFSDCFHLYLRKPTAAKSCILMCCISYSIFLWCPSHSFILLYVNILRGQVIFIRYLSDQSFKLTRILK